MNDNGHTPTPWKAVDVRSTERGKRGVVYYQIKPANGAKASIGFAGVYEGANPAADAEFIIKACNAYDEQTAQLAAARERISHLEKELSDIRNGRHLVYGKRRD